MTPEEPIRAEDVRRAAELVKEHPQREPLSALAFELLSRQAEGRTLFAGKEHVDSLAQSHGVGRDDAEVERTLKALTAAAAGDENLVPRILDCARAYCTLYEIRHAMEEVFGAYKEPVFF
ncbi:MAG: hypothetical protein KY453_05525 [Gemmatimonadetes bacterium]|nr:hypothetical protein [Gemmatimonadota bacterium]